MEVSSRMQMIAMNIPVQPGVGSQLPLDWIFGWCLLKLTDW